MGMNEDDVVSEQAQKRLGRLPMKTTRQALLFSDFFKYVDIPKTQTYWKKKKPFPLRSYGNLQYGNCVTAGTAVTAPFVMGAVRSMYSGPGVVLRFASGVNLTVTPNHQVLTTHGFISAAALQVGDEVVNTSDSDRVSRLLDKDFNHGPARIFDVFQSLPSVRVVPDAPNRSIGKQESYLPRPNDFHGDGRSIVGQIDVVRSDALLGNHGEAALLEHIGYHNLPLAAVESFAFSGLCAQDLGVKRVGCAPSSGGSSLSHSGLRSRSDVRGCQPSRFTSVALYAQLSKLPYKSTWVDTEYVSQFDGAFTAQVPLDHVRIDLDAPGLLSGNSVSSALFRSHPVASNLGGFLHSSYGDTSAEEVSSESALHDAGLFGQLVHRFPSLISTDKVVEIRDVHLSEHVYDLSTGLGWYSANGILVHNCTRAKQAVAATRMERIESNGRLTINIPDSEVIRVYREMSNRLYGGGDNGAYEDDALKEWRDPDKTFRDSDGHPHTIDAYLRINAANHDEVRAAIALAGAKGVAGCLNLPQAFSRIDPPTTWDVPKDSPLIGEWLPGSWGGHSVWIHGMEKAGPVLDTTWELPGNIITWEACAAYMDENHLVIDSADSWRKAAATRKIRSAIGDVIDAVNAVSANRITA